MKTILIGIDPGISGGMAVLLPGSNLPVTYPFPKRKKSKKKPGTEIEEKIVDTLQCWSEHGSSTVVALERVTGYVTDSYHIRGQASSMFKLGASWGALRMASAAIGAEVIDIPAAVWQRQLGITRIKGSNPESYSQWKNRLKEEAKIRFPNITVTLRTADALLILAWLKGRC